MKIPITNTKGQPATELISGLSSEGIMLNITAIFTPGRVRAVTMHSIPRRRRSFQFLLDASLTLASIQFHT